MAGKKPTIGELSLLKYDKDGKTERLAIIKAASHKWREITHLLAPRDANLVNKLAEKYRDNHEECLRAVLVEYFLNNTPTDYDNDWDGLLELLEDVGLKELKAEVECALQLLSSGGATSPRSSATKTPGAASRTTSSACKNSSNSIGTNRAMVMPSSLQRRVAPDVLQSHYADLNDVIASNVQAFGCYLVQFNFANTATIQEKTDTLGFSDYNKAGKLLSLIDSRLKTATSNENARDLFNYLVLIIANKMDRKDIAQALVDTYKSKDPTYVSPLQEETTHEDHEEQGHPQLETATPQQEAQSVTTFSEGMSIEEFTDFLKKEGLCESDCKLLIEKGGFRAKSFKTDLEEDDMKELGLTLAGKKVVKRILTKVKQ